jgi:hypothetical protein
MPAKYSSVAAFFDALGCEDFAVSYSSLKTIETSFAAFRDYHTEERPADTAAIKEGRALHSFLLEPETFWATYEEAPAEWKTTGSKQWLERELERGKELIKPADIVLLERLRQNLQNSTCGAVKMLFDPNTRKEFELPSSTKIKGHRIKGYVDAFDDRCIVDIKSYSKDFSPYSYRRAVWDYSYHLQAVFYQNAIQQLTRAPKLLPFYNVVVFPKTGEYRVVQYDAQLLNEGEQLAAKLLARLGEFKIAGEAAIQAERDAVIKLSDYY